uniref:DNA topoisomerase n=1 Tax=Panagrolaimus sp. ES5 TaxID=591445 RepID=A0AC34G4U9_9BILA
MLCQNAVLFSSAPEILTAIENLTRPNFRVYLSTVAKHYIDFRNGVALSRCQKEIARFYLPQKSINKLSFYPCGSTCLKLIVDQYDKVQKSPTKYCLQFVFNIDGKEILFCCGEYSEDEAEKLCKKLNEINLCEVVEMTKSDPIKKDALAGLNTYELMKFLSRYLHIHTTAAAALVQKLYELGLISYPRSETSKYTKDLTVNQQQLCANLLKFNSKFEDTDIFKAIKEMKIEVEKALDKGEDCKDHPPITPTEKWLEDLNEMRYDREELEIVYNFIVRRFLASFADDYQYCEETIKFKIGEEDEFQYSYFTTENPGFTTLLPELIKDGTRDESLLPLLKIGSELPFKVEAKEIELVQVMEDNHIGTDGSIPTHIYNIEKNGLVKIDNDSFEFNPEKLGLLMSKSYEKCIPNSIDPMFRAKFFRDLKAIASGEKKFAEVYDKIMIKIDQNFQQLSKTFDDYFYKHIADFRDCFQDITKRLPVRKCLF